MTDQKTTDPKELARLKQEHIALSETTAVIQAADEWCRARGLHCGALHDMSRLLSLIDAAHEKEEEERAKDTAASDHS